MEQYGWTSLMRACDYGHLDILNVLIHNVVDIYDIYNASVVCL